jgi:hypothetical protein
VVKGAAAVLAGPAGYAVPLIVGAVLIYAAYHVLKAPAQAVYGGAQNLDQNLGLGGFDAWVSSLFSAPVQTP